MELIKNIEKNKVNPIKDLLDYEDGKVASISLASTKGVRVTMMAFDEGESIASHAAPGDAMVVDLEGDVEIIVDGTKHILHEGDSLVMPKGLPHSLKALTKYKMLLTVVFEVE